MKKRRQCKACPWKTSTAPVEDIPGGYSLEKHKRLVGTIAVPGKLEFNDFIHLMACHETNSPGEEEPCVGWVMNQLGAGNNIPLRILALDGRFDNYVLVGEQHGCFDDTLPKETLMDHFEVRLGLAIQAVFELDDESIQIHFELEPVSGTKTKFTITLDGMEKLRDECWDRAKTGSEGWALEPSERAACRRTALALTERVAEIKGEDPPSRWAY